MKKIANTAIAVFSYVTAFTGLDVLFSSFIMHSTFRFSFGPDFIAPAALAMVITLLEPFELK